MARRTLSPNGRAEQPDPFGELGQHGRGQPGGQAEAQHRQDRAAVGDVEGDQHHQRGGD